MSLTGYCISGPHLSVPSAVADGDIGEIEPHRGKISPENAVSAIDGNICRCTGYKSIERAAEQLCSQLANGGGRFVPDYFAEMPRRLSELNVTTKAEIRAVASVPFVSGGTDIYVQRPDEIADADAQHLFYDDALCTIRVNGEYIEIGASVTVTDLLESPLMQSIFPRLYEHLKLVSSTPIRNMATLAGNFVDASPIGDMTVWFLALNAEITLNTGREMLLRKLYLDYKKLSKEPDEYIKTIRFKKPHSDFRFNFEKVSKRTYLDIASVNTAISLKVEPVPGKTWTPPALSVPPAVAGGAFSNDSLDYFITDAHVAAGGVAPIPLYLKEASSFLIGRHVDEDTIQKAGDIIQAEISPISDVRGSEEYKRLLLRQLFRAHFYELFSL
jgi:xanthine dehydrogenase small subunit